MEDLIQLLFFIVVVGFGLLLKFLQKSFGHPTETDSDTFERPDVFDAPQGELSREDHDSVSAQYAGYPTPSRPNDTAYDAFADATGKAEQYSHNADIAPSRPSEANSGQQSAREADTESSAENETLNQTAYDEQTSAYHTTPAIETDVEHPEHETAWRTGREVGEESLRRAFPKRKRRSARWRKRGQGTIQINVKGRGQLRKAILMNEVITRPRAFDV